MSTEPEHDEATDPDPATVVPLEDYDEGHTPGAPTRQELAADTNLFGAGDDPISDDAPAETGDHQDGEG